MRVFVPSFAFTLLMFLWTATLPAAEKPQVTFEHEKPKLRILMNGEAVATYVYQDERIRRPYFEDVKTLDGIRVTRPNPPVAGKDLVDHPDMHPGLWLAFGDLGGIDFWRNKGTVEHLKLTFPPAPDGTGIFVVINDYRQGERTVCRETCGFTVRLESDGWWLLWASEFHGQQPVTFGDQEEMGLGLRVATALNAKAGGQILNAEGARQEKEVWGKQSAWCDYSGTIDSRWVGVQIIPHPQNFRECWFHARDYGLLVANSFGQKAFTKGKASAVKMLPPESMTLRFGVFIHSADKADSECLKRAFETYSSDSLVKP